MINYITILFSLVLHALVLSLVFDAGESKKLAQEEAIKLKFKQVEVRKIGLDKAQDNQNLFGQLAYGKPTYSEKEIKRVDQEVKSRSSALSKKEEQRIIKVAKKESVQKNQILQKRISKESFKDANWTNELSHVQEATVSFLPPKGISPDKLNEFEKVFYAFYKRVAVQYINSVQISVRNRVTERPYVQESLRSASAQELKAVVRYDEKGNAEIVKILKSSEDDDIHKIFETALGKMNKIPNIVKDLKDEDGKYYAIFTLSVNTRR
ncbi:hypothetical protein ABMA79_01555 [Halobacteriovorax sp. HFRX-2_2]|uniref:hypothetical protein n=1 Tax=Halobacteriovorax sp. HFRX-2_2 TaxID=3157717 RepID=UPI003713F89A